MGTFKDKLGRMVSVGDFIAYGHAMGRCAGLRIGVILEITIKKDPRRERDLWRITVQGIDDDWEHNDLSLCRKGTLQFPSRILRLDPNEVPAKYRSLFSTLPV